MSSRPVKGSGLVSIGNRKYNQSPSVYIYFINYRVFPFLDVLLNEFYIFRIVIYLV